MRKKIVLLVMLLTAILFVGCQDRTKGELNNLLLDVAAEDAIVDADDWSQIAEFVESQKAHFKDFYKDGQLDIDEVEDYIEDFFENRRPAQSVQFIGVGGKKYLSVKFYLERSGSMTPYDTTDGDGSFKAAIVSMLNNLPGEENSVFVVNDGVYPYPEGTAQFVADRNIFESTRGIGDASFTDFAAIFDTILNNTGKDELSILVTDMIYSTRGMGAVNVQKVFADAQGMTQSVFKSQVKDKSMVVVKMTGMYSGSYYPYTQQGGVAYKGLRPYYIVMVGDNDTMARLTHDSNYTAFNRISELRGFENMYLFTADDVYDPYYSLLLAGDDIRGRFQPERGQGDRITNIESVEPDKNTGDVRLALAVDLSGMLIDEEYLTDKNNYEVKSDGKVEIVSIRPVDKKDATPAEKKYLKTATHIFVLHVDGAKTRQEVDIKLMNRLPGWVLTTSADDDRDVKAPAFAQQTFGLKYLMQGIYDSYRRYSDEAPYYFDMEIELR